MTGGTRELSLEARAVALDGKAISATITCSEAETTGTVAPSSNTISGDIDFVNLAITLPVNYGETAKERTFTLKVTCDNEVESYVIVQAAALHPPTPGTTIPPVLIPNTADPNDDGVIDGDLWWAGTHVTTVEGSGVIGKYFAENHYDYAYCYTWNYITQNGTNRIGIICPDGWRLPTQKEFVALVKASGFTGTNQTGLDPATTGYATVNKINGRWFGPGIANNAGNYTTDTHIFIPFAGHSNHVNNAVGSSNVGSYAYVWSSSPCSSGAYSLDLNSSRVTPQYRNPRTYGFPVRCVADPL